ncbi:hypothetical protein INT43_006736 [Umbelopsis isabellina]|uniref:Uncharacterized protein n=1 Tax=Mortierella isabellina TaxID=91625 RepID=A0A8H7UHX9_MORIS|nr:hypothetical protein INT43_006736 [Umbelopsis isabellina]
MRVSLSVLALVASVALTSALPVDSFNAYHEDAAHVTTTATTTKAATTTKKATTTTKKVTSTKTSSSPTSHPTAPFGREISVKSTADFCLFLPPTPGADVATTEDFGVLYCAKGTAGAPGAKTFPSGFITTSHFAKSSSYIQVTGYLDRTKYKLKASDEGGQYDNHGNGKPTGAQCKGYNYFVSLIEPANNRFCIRCCQNKVDCNTGRSGYGCERVVPGDYSQSSSHSNTDYASVLDEISYGHINAIEPTNNNTANTPLLAFPPEITKLETLSEDETVEQFKAEWTSFVSQLKTSYPNSVSDIEALDNATENITDVEGWHQFIALLKTKVDGYLYPGESSDDDTDNNTAPAAAPATNENDASVWHEDDITPPTDNTATSDDTDGSDSTSDADNDTADTDPPTTSNDEEVNNGTNSTGTVSDSFDDYVTVQDLDTELNSKFDAFESKLLDEIKSIINNQGSSATTDDSTVSPSDSTHNNQATW